MHGVVRGEGPAVGRLASAAGTVVRVLPGDGAGDHLDLSTVASALSLMSPRVMP